MDKLCHEYDLADTCSTKHSDLIASTKRNKQIDNLDPRLKERPLFPRATDAPALFPKIDKRAALIGGLSSMGLPNTSNIRPSVSLRAVRPAHRAAQQMYPRLVL